jgi:hypothetical protein
MSGLFSWRPERSQYNDLRGGKRHVFIWKTIATLVDEGSGRSALATGYKEVA